MLRLLLAFWLGMLGIGGANAALYTYNFIGTVRAMADDPGNVHFNFKTGDQIAFSFTLTDESINHLVGFTIDGTRGGFGRFQDVIYSNPTPDSDPGTFDHLDIVAAGPQAPSLRIRFASTGDNAFDDGGRFPSVIDPTRFDEAIFEYHIALTSVFADGTLDRVAPVTAVPEPGTITIFGAALLALMLLARRVRPRREPPFIAD